MAIARLTVVLALFVALPVSALSVSESGLFKDVRSATRLPDAPMDERRWPGTVHVLEGEELTRFGAKTVADALKRVPGVVSFDQVGNTFQPTIDFRGWNASPVPATTVVLDGVRINELDFGQVNWQLIPLADVERIEVLPGPTTLYGKDALAGTVLIYTRRGTRNTEGEIEAAAGSYGRTRGAASARGMASPLGLDWSFSGSHEREDGYRRGAPSKVSTLRAVLGKRGEGYDSTISYQYADDRLTQGGSLTEDELAADRRQHVSLAKNESQLHLLSSNARLRLMEGLSLAVNGHLRERLENTPLNRGRTSNSDARSDMHSAGGVGQLTFDHTAADRRFILAAGVEGTGSHGQSTSAGDFGGFPFNSGSIETRRRLGFFTQASADILPRNLTLTAAWRYDRDRLDFKDLVASANDGRRSYERGSPRVGLDYSPHPLVDLRVSYGEAYRVPTAQEISSVGPLSSTPDLRPVKSRSWEAGARWKHPSWGSAELAVYRTSAHDEIYFDPTLGNFGQNRNIEGTLRRGLELSLRPRLGAVDAWFDWSYTEATFESQFTLSKVPFTTQTIKPGANIPLVPKHRVSLGAEAPLNEYLSASAGGICASAASIVGDESNTEPRLASWCSLDLGLTYKRAGWTASLSVDNALDAQYETRGILSTQAGVAKPFLVPHPGRTFLIRLARRFSMG